jgi:hypothetical protein
VWSRNCIDSERSHRIGKTGKSSAVDFMFELAADEVSNLGGRRYLPRAFTEQGVAMRSSVGAALSLHTKAGNALGSAFQ